MKPRSTAPTAERPGKRAAGRPRTPGVDEIIEVEFTLDMPAARSVAVCGTFNNWEPEATPLHKERSGWKAIVPLLPGRYEYRFVVDGEWMSDPKAAESVENSLGSRNSVIVVGQTGSRT